MRPLPCALLLVLASLALRSAHAEDPARLVRESAWQSPDDERKSFHLPEGFEIQLFADDTQLGGKPVNLAFDAHGRLWVTSTQEYPFAVKRDRWSPDTTQAPGSKDSIRILEDTDGDGRADRVTVFASDLNIPTGLQPYRNGCIAWSIPNILFLEDTQHNGRAEKADKRSILFGPLGYEKDTHGMISSMRLGLDGWIYATHGFSNTSKFAVRKAEGGVRNAPASASTPASGTPNSALRTPDSHTLEITSGSVFRFRPDGSAVELWTSGQVNPFGLCWDSWGNLYSADCHSSPIYQLIRGATYPQFGKPADALGFGPVMCEHAHGSTGIAGIIYLDGGVWGPEWDDHLFVGNPVTSKVNHDLITFTGSTPKANERPDFLTSDDGWFRPVDLQLGPDGALYIADFYTPIIGHYEVPLDDKRRDRKSGRIWRVVRKGYTGRLTECDLTRLAAPELRKETQFGKGNLTRGFIAASLLRERHDDHVEPRLPAGPADTPRLLRRAFRDHPGGAVSPDAMEHVIANFLRIPPQDTHLLHALRLLLREMLSHPASFEALTKLTLDPDVANELIRIACAVPTTDAANWLLGQLAGQTRRSPHAAPDPGGGAPPLPSSKSKASLLTDRALLTQVLTHIARHLPAAREGELAEMVQRHFGEDLDIQLDLFAAVREGRAGRPSPPASPGDPLRRWTDSLAQRLTDALQPQQMPDWQPVAPPSAASPNPWFKQRRACADGVERDFLCSLPPGGEKLTGTLRSKTFDLPPRLGFWLAGHRGFPNTPAHEKNLARLVDAETGRELALAFPPRHNTARWIVWQTGKMPAKRAYLELVDGDDATAYAWLAAGGFEPRVVPIPELNSPANDKRVRQAAELALAAKTRGNGSAPIERQPSNAYPELAKLLRALPHPESYQAETRVALARLDAGPSWPAELPDLARDPLLATAIFDLLKQTSPTPAGLTQPFKALTSPAQVKLASALATTRESAAALIESAPPRVLADPLVSGKIKALGDAAILRQLEAITAKLPPPNTAVNALIAARLKSFQPAEAGADRGRLVFAQTCVACHRIGILGNLVGPQLDGIGARGPERLLEDILDPNRAVDPAFRLHIVKLKSGGLMTGLLRRAEGDDLVFADAAGQEHRVPKNDVAEDQTSEFSLMPAGLGEVLTEPQLHDLLKFLLDRKP